MVGRQRHLHAPRLRGRHPPRAAAQRFEPLQSAANRFARVEGQEVGRATFKPNEETELFVALQPRGDECVVVFSVSPTGVPAELTHGGNPDTRVLGVHFDRFDYSTS